MQTKHTILFTEDPDSWGSQDWVFVELIRRGQEKVELVRLEGSEPATFEVDLEGGDELRLGFTIGIHDGSAWEESGIRMYGGCPNQSRNSGAYCSVQCSINRTSSGWHLTWDPYGDVYGRTKTPVPRQIPQRLGSPIEDSFAAALRASNVGNNYELHVQHQIGNYRVDFAHIPTKTAIELDGFEFHSSTEDIAKDRRRDRDLSELGWHVVRFGGREIHQDAETCVREVVRILERRSKGAS